MPTKAKKVEAPEVVWPESINLNEKLPAGHKYAGYPRYALIQGGAGRIDQSCQRVVPQDLVDKAVAALEQAAAA